VPDELFERFRRGNRQALARLLTLTARGEGLQEIRSLVGSQPPRRSRVVAVTGSAGVGKSTLIGRLIELFRGRNETVAVLACDPESPLTGGALLGDRFRMPVRADDEGVYVRSLATAGGRGAVAEHLDLMVRLLGAFAFDWIILETVGAGQGDTDVRLLADAVVVLLQPEAGDDIQWEKAGLLEVADVVVVHKGDLPRAEQVEAQVRGLLNLPGCRPVPVFRVSSTKNEGFAELYGVLKSLTESVGARRSPPQARFLHLLREEIGLRLAQRAREIGPVIDRWERGELSEQGAVDEALRLLLARA
jgi:LAO/AO transport system ATPase